MLIEMEPEDRYLLSWTYTNLDLDDPGIIITGEEKEQEPAKKFNYGGLPTNWQDKQVIGFEFQEKYKDNCFGSYAAVGHVSNFCRGIHGSGQDSGT